jgi:hypothetical protein
MSDVDKKLAEIRERHERDAMRCISPSIAGPQAHDDREWLLSEIERLRARVAELEKPLAARLSRSQGYYQQRTDGNDDLYRRAHEEREP